MSGSQLWFPLAAVITCPLLALLCKKCLTFAGLFRISL
uniref:Uncharacterized protein n=1 Tax=Anguilla anguilla TaxID=7936 RepID=A0A0E9XBL1_ANGAN